MYIISILLLFASAVPTSGHALRRGNLRTQHGILNKPQENDAPIDETTDDCVPDGEVVQMNLYKHEYSQEQNNISELDDMCCSGTSGDQTCMSATGTEDGKVWYAGSCEGVCGADAGPVRFISM